VTAAGIVAHPGRERARLLAAKLTAQLAEQGVEVRIPRPDAEAIGLPEYGTDVADFARGLDFAVSLGGDGTMLRAVDLVFASEVPVLGINLGQLGFLTGVEVDDVDDALARVMAGDFEIEERMVLQVEVASGGPAGGTWSALNECLLEKASPGRLVRLAVSLAGTFFTTYAADGMIVATPTGSTAYAFSVRGPIISPGLRCLLMTPVSPHMLFDRSLVLSGDEDIRMEILDEPEVELTIDGRSLGLLAPGDAVTVSASPKSARFIVFRARDFHLMLKAKFGLSDR
jgi:NAD+ kinase